MYETDIEPTYSFERAAQTMGLNRARELWAFYKIEDQRRDVESKALEDCMARDASKRNYIVNEELGGQVEWRMSPTSYVDIYRASLPEKDCVGGEFLNDSHYMRWWLKRNPQCRIMSKSGVIQSGWTPESDPLYRASVAGKRYARAQSMDHRLSVAAHEGAVERTKEDQRIIAA